jgi:hypothetical protein
MNLRTLGFCLLAAAASATAAVDPVLLNLVMPDAKVLSGIQVDQSVASPFGQYLLAQMQAGDASFQKFILATGFDPRRDLNQILGATNSDGTSASPSVLALGRGTFVPSQILAAAIAQGGVITQYKGFSIIAAPVATQATTGVNTTTSGTAASTTAMVFLDGTTAAAGDIASVQGAIDRYLSPVTYSTPLGQKAQTVSVTNQAWFATTTPLSVFLGGKLGGTGLNSVSQNGLLQSVLQASGGVNFGSTAVTVTGDAVTASGQNAQALVDVLKFVVSMIPSSDPKVASLANSATFSVNGTTAHLSLSLPEQQVEQLFMPEAGAKARKARPAQVR